MNPAHIAEPAVFESDAADPSEIRLDGLPALDGGSEVLTIVDDVERLVAEARTLSGELRADAIRRATAKVTEGWTAVDALREEVEEGLKLARAAALGLHVALQEIGDVRDGALEYPPYLRDLLLARLGRMADPAEAAEQSAAALAQVRVVEEGTADMLHDVDVCMNYAASLVAGLEAGQ